MPNIPERLIYPLQVLISLLDEITPQKERCRAAFSITYSWRRLCLFPDFTLNLQTTALHRADAGAALEAGLEGALTREKTMLLQQRLRKKRAEKA